MSESEEKSKNSRTISIEIPNGGFEEMFRMMTGRSSSETARSGSCEPSRNSCCGPSAKNEDQELKIVIRRKEK